MSPPAVPTAEASRLGIFCKTTDSAMIEAAALAGLDFVILDREHGPSDWHQVQQHIRAARLGGAMPIVRVSALDHHAIGMAYDLGAEGVQVPNIATPDQARRAVEAARFHPIGARGICRFVAAAGYGSVDKAEYFARENRKTLILQVEGAEGVARIDEILAVEGVDVLFIGPYDLSQSVGTPGEITSPAVLEAISRISSAARARNRALGIFCDTPALLAEARRQAVAYVAYSVDVSIFRDAVLALKA
ncbi:MAG: aldolase/citrate lyase family protein [Pseudomonadota bacterium]